MSRWPQPDMTLPWPQRFWSKIDASGDCWLWTASKDSHGYGRWSTGRTLLGEAAAHRVAYALLVGPIPDGLTIDHLCRNPPCVNPDHLEPVTHRVNIQRGERVGRPRRTHCKEGHPLEGENLYVKPSGERICRICRREAGRLQGRKHYHGLTNPDRPLLIECKRGHLYNEANTYVDPQGRRHCRACRNTTARTRRM